jgi:hypothetical protein
MSMSMSVGVFLECEPQGRDMNVPGRRKVAVARGRVVRRRPCQWYVAKTMSGTVRPAEKRNEA